MKAESARIFRQAGVEVEWLECEVAGRPSNLDRCALPLGPVRLMLQLAPGRNVRSPRASGFAVIQNGSSVFACLYPARLSELARATNWEFGDLLGHAAAHELGHLLLRSPAHTSAGLMRARWETEDLHRLPHAGLIFLPGQLRLSETVAPGPTVNAPVQSESALQPGRSSGRVISEMIRLGALLSVSFGPNIFNWRLSCVVYG